MKLQPDPVISREQFIAATGREPEQDDLERCNCPLAGTLTHQHCGWSEAFDLPWFDVPFLQPLRRMH